MKIKTGLPYDFSLMDKIKENGAIIDMSNLNYPSIEKENYVRVSYIFLRNTEYNKEKSKLDFSKCSYDFKEKFILFYLNGDIVYYFDEIKNTLLKILGVLTNQNFEIESILTNEEIDIFIKNNKSFLDELFTIIYSLPLYPISRFDIEDENFKNSFKDIKHIEKRPFNTNFDSLIETPFLLELYSFDSQIEPVFYDNYFSNDNNELLKVLCQYTPFNTLLFGMSKPEEWTVFVDGLEEQIKELETNG